METIYTIRLRLLMELPNRKIKGCEWLPNDFPGEQSYPLFYSENREICQKIINGLTSHAISNNYPREGFYLFIDEMSRSEFDEQSRYELNIFYPIIDQEELAQVPLVEMDQYISGNWKDINFWAEGDFCDHDSDCSCVCSCDCSGSEVYSS